MTTLQAIDGVMMTLDEVGVEYYSPVEVLLALEQAQLSLARQYIQQGRKYFIQPLLRYNVPIIGNGTAGINIVAQLNETPMVFEACKLKYHASEVQPQHHARYIPPQEFEYYRMLRPGVVGGGAHRAGRLEYSYSANLLYHNGADTVAWLTLYVEPVLPTDQTPLSLSEQCHKFVVDKAAQILYAKEVQMPDHDLAGTNADIFEQITIAKQAGAKQ